ncbi:MAG: diacylglycerol kinase [Pseudomonadota bacterium]
MKPGKAGFKRVVDATVYSFKGFRAAYKHEAAFRQELAMACVAIPIAALIAESALQFLALSIPMLLILLAELANSAIEALADRISEEHHELSGRAKDMGSALVFVSLSIAGISWLVILTDRYVF